MELALYCPNFGYYERAQSSPGRKGDFFTSVSTGPLFGEMLAWQFAEWSKELPAGSWQILEAGALDGQLAADTLRWLREHRPALYARVEYLILEPSARLRERQKETLARFPAKWLETWDRVPNSGVSGVVFGNELLDAMPVHRLGWNASSRKWFEWGVALERDEFAWAKTGLSGAVKLPSLPDELLGVLPDGFTTEVCPAATEWWRRAARALQRGKLVTFDYGLEAHDFWTPQRNEGTLRAYFRHHSNSELLGRAGEQDLTAHVNFTALREAGENEGLTTESFTDQARFLSERLKSGCGPWENWSPAQVRQFQTLTHPEHLGAAFKVLVQSR
jgi:SAM-dependent MidA family methyltransferase